MLPQAQKDQNELIQQTFIDQGVDYVEIAKITAHVMNNAVTETRKGEIIEDFNAKLSAAKFAHKVLSNQPDTIVQNLNVFNTNDSVL